MSIDVYQTCPCGSGKKLKFCCHEIVNEMAKVRTLQENQQFRMALQTLDGLDKSHPRNPWVMTSRASLMLGDDRASEAKKVLETLLDDQPEHLFAIALYATTAFAADGFEPSKPAIQRALQRCISVYPDMVGGLAMGIAAWMFGSGKYMAARAHLGLAMRLMPEKERQDIFVRLLEFDGNREISYPLRSVHALVDYSGDEESTQQVQQAKRLADIGCWNLSARLYGQLVEKDAESGALWRNLGLCRAWDGDEAGAAEALHRAAGLHEDFADAVELETIAQLLDLNSTEDRVPVQTVQYPVKSVSKLLTRLGENDRLVKMEKPQNREQSQVSPAGLFQILDRSHGDEFDGQDLDPETIPHVVGQLTIYDIIPAQDAPARVFMTGFAGAELDSAREVFELAAGDEIDANEATTDDAATLESLPSEQMPLHWRWYFPPKTPIETRTRLEQQQWQEVISSIWPNRVLAGLHGKTPSEAAEDAEFRVPLAAALFVLDTFCESNQHALDLAALAGQLHVELPGPVELSESTSLNSFSAMRLNRLPIRELTDDQLSYTLNRALLIHHSMFLYEVLTEALSRPSCTEKVDLNRVYGTLADLCRDQFRFEESLEWTLKGKEYAKSLKDGFEETMRWEMRELLLRLHHPDDPELPAFLSRLRNYYSAKLPQFEAYLSSLLEAYGVQPPWSAGEGILTAGVEAGETTSGGIWTPGEAEESSGDEKKLWIPGQ